MRSKINRRAEGSRGLSKVCGKGMGKGDAGEIWTYPKDNYNVYLTQPGCSGVQVVGLNKRMLAIR